MAIYDAQGRPLLSWRVLLLPYMEGNELYEQFRLDEPWDSAHNHALLEKMPSVYRRPVQGLPRAERYATIYRAVTGPGTVFGSPDALSLERILRGDGTSYTLLVVEAGESVPWTKPDELVFQPDQPLPAVGGLYHGVFRPFSSDFRSSTFQGLFADGHVESLRLPENDGEEKLRGAVTWNGGEEIVLP